MHHLCISGLLFNDCVLGVMLRQAVRSVQASSMKLPRSSLTSWRQKAQSAVVAAELLGAPGIATRSKDATRGSCQGLRKQCFESASFAV